MVGGAGVSWMWSAVGTGWLGAGYREGSSPVMSAWSRLLWASFAVTWAVVIACGPFPWFMDLLYALMLAQAVAFLVEDAP